MSILKLCLREERLPPVGGLPWPLSQLLASVYMEKRSCPSLIWLWGNWEELLFPRQTFLYSCTSLGLKSTELNWHGHLYCFKQLIKDWIIAEVKAHLLSWDFVDNFDCDLAFATILEITKFAHTHCISSCPSQASQRETNCVRSKKLSRLLASPYLAKQVTLPPASPFPETTCNFSCKPVSAIYKEMCLKSSRPGSLGG